MAKRITISVRDEDYKKLEFKAKSEGLKVIDLINKKVKSKTNFSKILKLNEEILYENSSLKKSINELKDQMIFLQKIVLEVAKLNTEYSAYSKIILTEISRNIMKNKTPIEVQEELEKYLSLAQKESTKEIRNILTE